MAQFLLTATSLQSQIKEAAAHAAQRRTRVRVSDGNNLYLVVRENGSASWQLLAWVAGKRKPITLGRWPDLTLKRARDLAQAQRDTVATGVDPVAKRREERQQAAIKATEDTWNVLRLFNRWLDKHTGSFAAIINPDEAAIMMRRINAYGSTVVRTLLILSAHLFQRPTELRAAQWDQFDLEAARWTLPDEVMKKDKEHWVPLSPQVVRILRAHQGVVGSEGLLFPGRKYGQPVSESTALEALRRMGYAGKHTVHGFRAMANTILVEKFKVNERHIDKQLSHQDPNEIRRVYNRAAFWDERIDLMTLWSGWLDEQMQAP